MASSIALRRLASKNLMPGNILRPFRSVSAAPSVTRSYNTNAQMTRVDDDDRCHREVSRRGREFPGLFSEVFDPFRPTRSVNQLMNIMDQIMENPLISATRGAGQAGGIRSGWEVGEDDEALQLKVDMPGLGKEDVKVWVEENTLIIQGEGEKENGEKEDSRRRYSSRIDLTPNRYKVDGIKAEMKNGVLKVVIPKVKEDDERRDVFQVQIE